MELTLQKLESFRQQSDSIADELIVDLYNELDSKSIWKLYQNLISDLDELNYDGLPSIFQTYFKENQNIPNWVNKDLIKTAEQLFLDIGPLYSACLLCRALPIGYSSLKTVKVLTSTGYLSTDIKQGTAKRLLETTQFIFNVMEEGTFLTDSRGIKHILKVRFLHALIRNHLLKHNWDVGKYDIPINQEDMAGTILTFSVGAIMGLEQINVKLSIEEKNALVHYWAIIGDLIGVDNKLLPQHYNEAEELYLKILHHQAAYSTDGVQLTNALCNFIRGFLPVKYIPKFPEYLLHYLIGNNKFSQIIGVEAPQNYKDKFLFSSIIQYFRLLNRYRKNKIAHKIIQPANRIFASNLTTYFSKEFDLKLHIPKNIKYAWGLNYSG